MEPRDALLYSHVIGFYPQILGKSPFFKENYDLVRVYGQYPKTPPSSLFRYENIQTKPTLAVKCIYNVKNPKCILQKDFAEEESL